MDPITLLSVAGSLASILGLGPQFSALIDKYSKNVQSEDVLGRLALQNVLMKTTQAWKDMHNKYLNLLPQINLICSFLSDTDSGHMRSKDLRYIQIDYIRNQFETLPMSNCKNFREELKSVEAALKRNVIEFKKDEFKKLKKDLIDLGYERISDNLDQIASYNGLVLDAHEDICNFFGKVKEFKPGTRIWGDAEKQYFLNNRLLLCSEFNTVFTNIDAILMCYLSVYLELSE